MDMAERVKLRGSSAVANAKVKSEHTARVQRNGTASEVAGELAIKPTGRLAKLLPRPDVLWLHRACTELAAVHNHEGSRLQQCGVCKRMVFSYLLSGGQHLERCIPADSPPTTGDDPRRRKARTASRQPSPVSPRPSARPVSPPSKRQKPAAVSPAQPPASHLNASFANSKLPQDAVCAANPVHPQASVPMRSLPPDPVPNPIYLSGKAAPLRRRRSLHRPRSKAFSFVPFDPSDFALDTLQQPQHAPSQHTTAQQQAQYPKHAQEQAHANMQRSKGANHRSLEMPPASSATSPTVPPHGRASTRRHPTTAAPGANASERYMPQQAHPRLSQAAHSGYPHPSPTVAACNAPLWAQHAQPQAQQQMPFAQARPGYANGTTAPLVHVPCGENSGCSQPHAHMHGQMHGVQQQQAASHRQSGTQHQQPSQRRHPLPISQAEMAKLFQTYLRTKRITREEFSQEHREAFKQMVLCLSQQRLSAQDGAGEQAQHAQQQQQQHLQHHPHQQLQYAVVMNNQNGLGRGVQMHLRHGQSSMVPSAVEHSPTHSLHALSGGLVPSCSALDTSMLSHSAMHGASGMHMHMNGARGGLPAGGSHGINNASAAPTTQQLASTHAQHMAAPHAVHAGGHHMHLQQPGMYPLGMQRHVMGHREAMNHMGGLAVQAHPNPRCG